MSGSDDSHHAENNINKSMRVRSGSTDSSSDFEESDEMSHDDDDNDDGEDNDGVDDDNDGVGGEYKDRDDDCYEK